MRADQILFLCTGNYYRSRFAEIVFNTRAPEHGVERRAFSRGLWTGDNPNEGPISRDALAALVRLGIDAPEAIRRFPVQARAADLDGAARIIALDGIEHPPMVRTQFPEYAGRISYWDVRDMPIETSERALARIEARVMDLLRGGA